jgi:hypothetical protein
MNHLGHTPASYLAKEYFHCLQTYEDARQQIAMTAIDLYHAEVSAQFREVKFKDLANEPDKYEANRANIKKVDGYFQQARTANLPFSFAHFIARAIDKLYARDCLTQIASLMAGPKNFAPGSTAAITDASQGFAKETSEAITGLIGLTARLDSLTEADILAQIKETDDALREGQRLRDALQLRLTKGVIA